MVSSKLLVVISCALVVSGQRPARIGDDGKPLLNRPVLEECKKRKKKHKKEAMEIACHSHRVKHLTKEDDQWMSFQST